MTAGAAVLPASIPYIGTVTSDGTLWVDSAGVAGQCDFV
jgi:hypothetical protein